MFFSSKKVVGLDIGTSAIKLAEVDYSRSGATVTSFGFIPTPVGAISSGDITSTGALSETIRELVAQARCKRKAVCTGLWGTAVIVKKITIPKIEKKLVAQQVRFEAEQYIPFDINEISLDYHVIDTPQSADTMDILLIATQNTLVSQYSQVVGGAGLKLQILDVSGFALANTFELNYGKIPNQAVALLNIGAGVSNFVVVQNGEVVFSRDVSIGGATYTNELSKELGITVPEAEALKMSALSGSGDIPEQVPQILASTNDMVTEEIRNSFDFFAASSAGQNISRCFFTGGASATPNLIQQTSQATGVPFAPLNPFARVKVARNLPAQYLQQVTPFAAVAVGLGLRKVGD